MRVLFLDDSETRHKKFRTMSIGHNVTHVYGYDDAVEALAGERFDEVWLDHDLSERASAGAPDPGEKTGYDVACYIEQMPPEKRPGYAVIHSLNPSGAARIGQALKAAGVRCRRQPLPA